MSKNSPLDTIPEDKAGEEAAEDAAKLNLNPAPPTPEPTPAPSPTPDDQPAPLSEEEQEAIAADLMQKEIDASFDAVKIDPKRIDSFKKIQAIHADAAKSSAAKSQEIRDYLESEEAKKTVAGDHAFKEFQKTVLTVLDATKKKTNAGPQTKEEHEKEEGEKSAFLGIAIDKFKFLGEAVPTFLDGNKKDQPNKAADVNNLTKALKDISEEKGATDLGIDASLKDQYNGHKNEASERFNIGIEKGNKAIKEGMSDVQAARFTMAQNVLMKTAQIAAIGALAATGGIFVAAILAGALYWWHTRNAGKNTDKKLSPEEQQKEDEKSFAEFQAREGKDIGSALKKAAEENGIPAEDLEEAEDMIADIAKNDPKNPALAPAPAPALTPTAPDAKDNSQPKPQPKEEEQVKKEGDEKEEEVAPPLPLENEGIKLPGQGDATTPSSEELTKKEMEEAQAKLRKAEENLNSATTKLQEAAQVQSNNKQKENTASTPAQETPAPASPQPAKADEDKAAEPKPKQESRVQALIREREEAIKKSAAESASEKSRGGRR